VIATTPLWLGQPSSITKMIPERLDAELVPRPYVRSTADDHRA
jgi:hypothetical protein